MPLVLKAKNPEIQKEIAEANIFKADFSNWQVGVSLDNNIHCLIFLTIFGLGIMFLVLGLYCYLKKKNNEK